MILDIKNIDIIILSKNDNKTKYCIGCDKNININMFQSKKSKYSEYCLDCKRIIKSRINKFKIRNVKLIENKEEKDTFIYIITNPAWKDYIKIGRSNNPEKRLFAYQTSSPYKDYKLNFYIKVKNISYIEMYFKLKFKISDEWYKIDKNEAIEIINKICIKC